jgi:hypothetical protein
MCSHKSSNYTGNLLFSNIVSTFCLHYQGTYSRFNIKVEALQIDQADLNTKRMLDMMAVGQDNGPIPLYMHTVQRILREMRIQQQRFGTGFNYAEFKDKILDSGLTPGQLEPLKQRLDCLESFIPQQQSLPKTGENESAKKRGSDWKPQVFYFYYLLRAYD